MRIASIRIPQWLPGGLLGVAAGIPLGLRIGYCSSLPLYGSDSDLAVQGLLLTGGVAAVVVVLLLWAIARRSAIALIAAGALVVSVVLGAMAAPAGPGSSQSAYGSGSAGTRDDAAAYWSGPVSCRWSQGDAVVDSVVGFDLVVSDPGMLAELGLDSAALNTGPSAKVVAITLPRALRGSAGLGVGESRDQYSGTGAPLAYEGASADGRAGRALSPHGNVVFTWSCAQGPA